MNVLVACEESQRVCTAFRAKGHNAFSADIMPPSGGRPEWHILGDVLKILNPPWQGIDVKTMDDERHFISHWDLIIAHPPCTYLTAAGNAWFNVEKYGDKAIERYRKRELAIDFFMEFVNADCDRIAIENPIGCMSRVFKKPNQIIQPYQFGHPVRKSTCLWLKNLPELKPTDMVDFDVKHSAGKSGGIAVTHGRHTMKTVKLYHGVILEPQ